LLRILKSNELVKHIALTFHTTTVFLCRK